MPLTYTVIVSYTGNEFIELTESPDRAAMHALAKRIARDATPEVSSVCVQVNGETFSWTADEALPDGTMAARKEFSFCEASGESGSQ